MSTRLKKKFASELKGSKKWKQEEQIKNNAWAKIGK